MQTLGAIDWAVIAGYFALLLVVVLFAMRRQQSTTDYFLAGRGAATGPRADEWLDRVFSSCLPL